MKGKGLPRICPEEPTQGQVPAGSRALASRYMVNDKSPRRKPEPKVTELESELMLKSVRFDTSTIMLPFCTAYPTAED